MVFHSVCEFFLLSPICSSLAFHWSDLYWPICFVISLLRGVIRESVRFTLRKMFLSFMVYLMSCGSGWSNFLSLPLEMRCLSARRTRFVSRVWGVYIVTSGGLVE